MTRDSAQLPEFDAPPVIEVVLAVTFEPLPGLTNVRLVETWVEVFRSRFPRVEERPAYDVPAEMFGSSPRPEVRISASFEPPPMRLWMISASDNELIQLQNGWFARNWRKVGEGDEYPRYEKHIRPAFADDWRQFQSYIEDNDLGTVKAVQCEVTYINHIKRQEFWNNHGDAARVFRSIGALETRWGKAESVALKASMVIIDETSKEPLGRIHAQIDSAFTHRTKEPLFVYSLTARGKPLGGSDIDAIIRFMDLGRERVVTSFVDWTTERAHQVWRRIQ